MDLRSLEDLARGRLDVMAFDYVAGAAGEEITARDNVAAWQAMRLRPHMLRDVSSVSTVTTVLGTPVAAPILVAPTAMHGLVCDAREPATARAAARCDTLYVVSMAATTSLEEIAAAAPGAPRWMQLYVQQDRGLTRAVCARAAAEGYSALVVTVDSPVTTRNPRNERNGFNVPPHLTLPNMAPPGADADIWALVAAYDPALTFDDLAEIRSWAPGLGLVVKGIVRGDDAARCVDAGADAIAVSNHGGREVDTCVSTARALPEVMDAVGDRAEVYVDGGLRDGADVLKALALGARATMVGRSVVWGLAIDGEDGAVAVLAELRRDLARTMALCGVVDAEDVPRDLVELP